MDPDLYRGHSKHMKKDFRVRALLALLISSAIPFVAAAQSGINLSAITPYSQGIINVINGILVPVLMAVALIVFLYGVYKYFILGAASDSDRETGRQFVLWGIIGFVIILSVWGLVLVVSGAFGLPLGGGAPHPPTI